jgi:CheY-like chemotaxis protein
LLSNASKYSDAGGQISISSHAENEMAVVHVADTGFGIPTEHLETIFALFAQIPEHRKRTGGGGLGIGLALARRLAELQRGSIEATSKGQGLGSEFVLRLPLHRADVDTEERSRASTIPPVPRPLRVLVVDDNADAAKSLAILIQVMGHNAVAAHDGATALAQMKTFKAEIVFLDLGLPDMHGNDVAKQIRELKGGPVRIYAVTGWSQQGEQTQAAGAFDSHLVKPVSAEQIGDILASIQESPST